MSGSLQINGVTWTVSVLGEKALILKPQEDDFELSLIHLGTEVLEKSGSPQITDIVPAYNSIALIFDRLVEDPEHHIDKIQSQLNRQSDPEISPKTHNVPVCYELGLDWEEVQKHTSLKKKEIVDKHIGGDYTVAMMGFIPGFLYLSGLDDKISCPRKAEPRTKIPGGSVGIAGNQTGIYSLESPGGWQIIGRTPDSFFDPKMDPPSEVKPGDKVEFYRISEAKFKKLNTKQRP